MPAKPSRDLKRQASEIIQQMLVDLGEGTDPVDQDDWPLFYSNLPDTPSKAVVVLDIAGDDHGRFMSSGEMQGHFGIRILVRGDGTSGYPKAASIRQTLDVQVKRTLVTVGDWSYRVNSINRKTDVLDQGMESPNTRRRVYSIEATAHIVIDSTIGSGSPA